MVLINMIEYIYYRTTASVYNLDLVLGRGLKKAIPAAKSHSIFWE